MKLNKYFLIAAMGLGLFACTDDDLDGNGQNGNKAPEGTTYAALKLNFGNNAKTKAAGDLPTAGAENEGTEGEQEVNTVRIVIVDANGKIEYNQKYAATANTADGTLAFPNATNNKEYVIKLSPGPKKFYAYVNETADMKLSEWSDNKEVVCAATDLYKYNATADGEKPANFAMSSTEVVEQPIQPEVTEEMLETSQVNHVELTVERMVAKVDITLKSADAVLAPSTEDETKLVVATTGESTIVLKSLTAELGSGDLYKVTAAEGTDPDWTSVTTFSYWGTYIMAQNTSGYRNTPYYEPTGYVYREFAANQPANFRKSFDENDVLLDYTASDVSGKTPTLTYYCLENTHDQYLETNTTYIKVKAEMLPKTVLSFKYTAADATEDPAVDEGIEIEAIENPALKDGVDDVVTLTAETFYLVTASAEGMKYVNHYVRVSELNALYNAINEADGFDDSFTGDDGDDDTLDEAEFAELTEKLKLLIQLELSGAYKDGKGVYNVWVNDLKEDGSFINKAPVFRNDWYSLSITKITLPGSSEEEVSDVEIHPDTYIQATIKIKPWNFIEHNIELQ